MTEVKKIIAHLESLIEDSSVPRNVRYSLSNAKQKLLTSEDEATGISGAVYSLEEVSNDINLPMHARTIIWNLLSELEAMKQ
ncbi:TPA: hypothetical protein HA318_04995 [Candidatus Micrarchaeota archaeon]|nr:MAG: hypothetical protein AUJ65_01605 [Candidatus Micrarchaeota archaeon CG1_02_51_15]HII39329.1 hypothetical protein [Candidatus Micrarchaeota archaeon]